MAQYIDKSALVAEIERLKSIQLSIFSRGETEKDCYEALSCISVYNEILSLLDTLEAKDANEALRTEYEKGRADVIQATEQWLANSWPKCCENHNIIKAFKENVIED